MNRVLITGGAGFVGSYLGMGLKKQRPDWHIVAFDNLKRRGSELNITRLREAGLEFAHGDIRNPEDLEAVGKVDLILECSAEPSVLAGYDSSPQYLVNTNLTGTVNCLEVARRHGAAMLFLSTSRVYPVATINALSYKEEATRLIPPCEIAVVIHVIEPAKDLVVYGELLAFPLREFPAIDRKVGNGRQQRHTGRIVGMCRGGLPIEFRRPSGVLCHPSHGRRAGVTGASHLNDIVDPLILPLRPSLRCTGHGNKEASAHGKAGRVVRSQSIIPPNSRGVLSDNSHLPSVQILARPPTPLRTPA